MKDAEGAEDVSEDGLFKEVFAEHWQDAQNVHHVQDGDGDDDGRDERLQVVTVSKKEKRKIGICRIRKFKENCRNVYKVLKLKISNVDLWVVFYYFWDFYCLNLVYKAQI